MSEVFSIQLSNHTTQPDGKTGVWLDLPATAEQVQAAMGQIGVTQDNPWDYFISGFSSPEGRHLAIPHDMVLASGVNELNFLAARLEKLNDYEIGTLNAALQQKNTEMRTIWRIIDYADNLDYYVNLPDIHTVAALGDYYLSRSGMVDMPDAWKPAIDVQALGKHIAGLEQGAFTEYGYIVRSGDEWRRVYEGQIVPEEYRVLSFPPPQVERDEASRPQLQQEQTAPASQPVIPIVLNGKNNVERMKEITDKLEAGIQALFESEQYKNYLTAMSKFHNYSFNNTLLIAMQKPDASLVAGYNKWKDEFERHVKRGERAIKILAPAPYKVRRQVEKLDASGRPIPGPDGKPLTEEQEVTVPAFKVVSVFDVSQTEGREIPDIAVDELTGSVERYQDFFTALERTSPVPIAFENIESGAHGYYHLEEKRIAIDEGMSELQNLKTAIHEIAHATLHAIDKDATPEELANRPDRRTREVQAESVAYAVCQHYGLDTSDYSFGYVAGWSSGKELSELKASLETIRATANDLITKIDGHLAQLQQEREAQQVEAPSIWNGLDGLINDKPFMPGATPEQQANALIDFAERDGQRLGNGERRLIVDYANVIRDYHKVADLINELCEDGFEIQHGHVDASVQMRVEREIAEAPPILLDPDAEPLVTVIWSESADLRDGEQMPLSQADVVFKALDDAMKNEPGYDKTKFRIDFTMNGEADNYEGRQDFGDGDGSLIEHIQGYHAKDTSKKIRATFQAKGRSGERLCTIPPYGYMKDPEDKKRWIVDEEAAAIVQKIFALCVDGLGPTQIAKWLQQNKILNPTAYAHEKGLPVCNAPTANPCKWTNETVSRILERVEYLGHTVNFKTSKPSFKSKKKVWNNPSEWVIFENTQEAIIEESVFLVVQNIRQARRRPTKMGDMGMFSGLVYCADCGGKMYLCRANHFKPEQEYYICSTYRKDRTLCKTHSIRRVVLEEIVLRNLREAIAYVTQYEDDFIQRAAERSQQERDKALAQKKALLAQSEKRIAELDVIFKRIYEDNISGKLSDDRFIKLSRDYEQEQEQLKTVVETLGREVKQQEQKKTNVRKFISVVKKYTDMTQLDATILREFVEQIRVSDTYTTDEQQKRVKIREIEIVYNFIGAFDFEGAREQSQTAQDKNIAKVGAA